MVRGVSIREMIVTSIVLAWLGLAFGSFVNAVVWRIHNQQKATSKKQKARYSILFARSTCTHCHQQLAVRDLVPVLSWLWLRGRCRYCGKAISWQYPIVELSLAAVFVLSYILWPGGVHSAGDWVSLISWLVVSIGLMALLVYDVRWMILPNRIVYPTLVVAVVGRLTYLIGFESDKARSLGAWALGVAIASGLFWLIYELSRGKLIGFGDVRLGLITGTVLARPAESFLMILLASVLGVIFALPGLVTRKKTLASRLPFGPFLIIATFIVLLYGSDFINWYQRVFLP